MTYFFNEVFFNSVRASIVDKYFYNHRIRKESVTHDTGKRLIDMIDVTEELLKNLLKNEKNYEEYHEVLLNYMIYIIQKRFKSIDPEYVNEFYKQYKSLIIRCITKYDIHEDMKDNLSDNFLEEYELCIKSINTSDDKIIEIQDSIELKSQISVVYDSSDHQSNEIQDTIKSIISQKVGFEYLEVLLVDNKENHKILSEYADNFANIKIISNNNYDNKYLETLKSVNTKYVVFINKEIDEELIDKEYEKIQHDKTDLVIITDQTEENPEIDFFVEDILFKTEFIDNENNFIYKDGIIKLKPVLYLKTSIDVDLMDIFIDNLDNNDTESFDEIISGIRTHFIKIRSSRKNKFFKKIREFMKMVITSYDYETFVNNLNKNNRNFTELVVKSLNDENEIIKDIKDDIKLDTPVCVMIYVKNNSLIELMNIFNTIVNQSFGFENIEILFIDNYSKNIKTIKLLKIFDKIYANVKYIRIRKGKQTIAHAYNIGFNKTSCPYIMFTNREHILINTSINDMFNKISRNNLNMVIGSTLDDTKLSSNIIYTNIVKSEFIKENEIRFILDKYNNVVFKDDVIELDGVIKDNIPVIKK